MHIIKRTLKKKQAIDTSEMPPAEISESILFEAFRTITTILSYIHSPSRRFSSETGPIGDGYDDREALKVLDALSAVLIRDHEIVAVVAPPYNEFLLQPGSDDQTRSLWGLFWATLNPRTSKIYGNTDSLQNNTSLPLIGDYEDKVPINLITAAKENAPVLEVFLQSHWCGESFETHIWMVKTLLEKLKEIDDEADPFLDYIICVSFQKMNRRMANEVISLPYYNCLQNWDRSSMLPSQTPRPRHKDRDKHFINIIPRLAKVAHTEIPNLTKVVAAYPQPDGIYNEETRIEFHLLLCELLSSYKASLEHLGRIQLQNPKLPEILKALGRVRTFGRYLRTVVRSSAIETHLETINSFLVVDTRKSWTPEPEDSEDADFQCLKPYSMRKGKVLLPWESYRDWLILMVHYFDAADVIVRHIRQLKLNRVGFSIKIITPPHPDKVLLPWSELLENELLFPAIPGKSSGKEFVRFFSSMPKVDLEMFAVAIDSATRLKLKLESDGLVQLDTDEIDALAQMVKRCTSVDWDDLNILSEEILALKESELVDRQVQMQAVVDSFQALSRRALFYNQLKDGPLQSGKKPRGTYHCEAYFASLLTLWDNASGQLVSDFKERMNTISAHGISEIKALLEKIKGCGYAIGVSKRCCPVCSYLLHLLNEHCGAKFVISDEHTNITPCALPVWLPGKIVRLMVLEFSGRLREELTKLREKSIRQLPVRDRAGSGTSGTRRILPDRIGSLRDTSDADDIDAFEWTGQLETLG